MFRKKIISGLCSLAFISAGLQAAQTGSFNTTIPFMGADRTLACYAPEQPSTEERPALIISLHGAGDNAVNAHDELIEKAKWQEILPNTIIIFPDGAALADDPNDQARDFYAPKGDEAIIDSVIAWAKKEYQIDESKIFLHGFSLGGRSALKWGLDNPTKIAGLVLNTPAVQSPMDVQNKDGFSLNFNYANASQLRISAVVGEDDMGFYNTVNMLADSLVLNKGKLLFINVPDMGHFITPNEATQVLFKFVQGGIAKSRPQIYKFVCETHYNTDKVSPIAIIRNIGNVPVTAMDIKYTVNGIEKVIKWEGTLNEADYAYITLPEETLPAGSTNIDGFISTNNGEDYPMNPLFNSQSIDFRVFAPAKAIPFKDDLSNIEETANNWAVKESGNYLSWMPASYSFGNGINALGMVNTILAYQNKGLTESLYSNVFDYSAAEKPAISFKVAYNYTHYTTQYFETATDLTDTLEVFISNDNGQTFSSIDKLWGEELKTFENVFTDPTVMDEYLVAPKSNEWATIKYNFDKADISDKTQFRFDYISGSGGVIYLTDFNFYDEAVNKVNEEKVSDFVIYPNPASSVINLPADLIQSANSIQVFDALGNLVINTNPSMRIDVSNLPAGIYTLKLGEKSSRFVVTK